MVIGLATDVGVGSERSGGGFFRLQLIELGGEDIFDALVGTDTGGKSTSAGCFETLVRGAFAEVEDAQAGSVGLLGVSSGGKDGFHQLSRMGPIFSAQRRKRAGDHSLYFRWEGDIWSGIVENRPRSLERG